MTYFLKHNSYFLDLFFNVFEKIFLKNRIIDLRKKTPKQQNVQKWMLYQFLPTVFVFVQCKSSGIAVIIYPTLARVANCPT